VVSVPPLVRPRATAMGWAATRTASVVAITVPMGKSVRVRRHPPATVTVPVPRAKPAATALASTARPMSTTAGPVGTSALSPMPARLVLAGPASWSRATRVSAIVTAMPPTAARPTRRRMRRTVGSADISAPREKPVSAGRVPVAQQAIAQTGRTVVMACASTSRRMSTTVDHAGMSVPQARSVRMAPVLLPVPPTGAPVVRAVTAVRAFVLTGSAVTTIVAVTRTLTVVVALLAVALAASVRIDSRQRERPLGPRLVYLIA